MWKLYIYETQKEPYMQLQTPEANILHSVHRHPSIIPNKGGRHRDKKKNHIPRLSLFGERLQSNTFFLFRAYNTRISPHPSNIPNEKDILSKKSRNPFLPLIICF